MPIERRCPKCGAQREVEERTSALSKTSSLRLLGLRSKHETILRCFACRSIETDAIFSAVETTDDPTRATEP